MYNYYFRKECDQTAQCLKQAGISAKPYHAGLGDKERLSIQANWLNEDECKVGTSKNP